MPAEVDVVEVAGVYNSPPVAKPESSVAQEVVGVESAPVAGIVTLTGLDGRFEGLNVVVPSVMLDMSDVL
jgi:hypothetical protein